MFHKLNYPNNLVPKCKTYTVVQRALELYANMSLSTAAVIRHVTCCLCRYLPRPRCEKIIYHIFSPYHCSIAMASLDDCVKRKMYFRLSY